MIFELSHMFVLIDLFLIDVEYYDNYALGLGIQLVKIFVLSKKGFDFKSFIPLKRKLYLEKKKTVLWSN